MDPYLMTAINLLRDTYWEFHDASNEPIVILGPAPRPPKWINPARKRFPLMTNRQFERRLIR